MLTLVTGLISVSVAVVGANVIRPIRFRFQEVRYLKLEYCISNLLFTPIIFFTFVKNFNNCQLFNNEEKIVLGNVAFSGHAFLLM